MSYTIPYDSHLAGALAGCGHDVDLYCARFAFADLPPPEGYRRHDIFFRHSARLLRNRPRSRLRFLLKGAEYVPDVRRLRKDVSRARPDVLHVQWLGLPRYDVRWLQAEAAERPVVFTAHDVLPRRTEQKVDLWRRIFGIVDRVVVHGQGAVEQLAGLGVDRDRIVRIPHPVFPPPTGRELPRPQGATLLFFGLIRESKGIDLLLRALPLIRDHVPGVRLVVAGDPIEPANALRRLATDLGIADRVDWRLRFLRDTEIEELLEQATLVVLPYRKIESSGVLATALGHGRPVVVTDVGSLGDIVREFDAGTVAHPEDPASLAAQCVALLQGGEALAAALRGTQAAREELTWERAAEAHERVYLQVLSERRS